MPANVNNRGLLITVLVILFAAFAVYFIQSGGKQHNNSVGASIDEVIDSAQDGAKELQEEVEDEIDDHTTAK